jgi:hypothetical protein
MIRRALSAGVLALALLASVASNARAQDAPADTSLHQFLQGLSDSTDSYFGLTAAPLDTAGLDSALVEGLEHPWRGPRTRTRFSYGPVYQFSRVDGTLWGASVGLGNRGRRLYLDSDLGYATGTHQWLGGGSLGHGIRRRDVYWYMKIAGGRRGAGMDRDNEEMRLASIRALVSGTDHQNYLRREGFDVSLSAQGPAWYSELRYRDVVERPLDVTTRWNLTHHVLETPSNLAAAHGRVRELGFETRMRLPRLPLWGYLARQTSDQAIGSDFDYRRTRVAVGGELPVGRHVSFLPQLAYGRLGGDAIPQASFYLGGAHSLRSLPSTSLGGTGLALARLDIIGVDDLLALAHIPHPAMFPIQGGLFVASGAVWGVDPFGGPGSPSASWPDKNAWLSEAGASLLYRPGIPYDDGYFRLNYAHPIGANAGKARWSLSYSRALDLLKPF